MVPDSTLDWLLDPVGFCQSPERVSNWAVDMLEAGYDAPSLADLTALGRDEWEKARRLSTRALQESALADLDEEGLRTMTFALLRARFASSTAPRALVRRLSHLLPPHLSSAGWRGELAEFFAWLDEDCWLIEGGGVPGPDNLEAHIRDAWRAFEAR